MDKVDAALQKSDEKVTLKIGKECEEWENELKQKVDRYLLYLEFDALYVLLKHLVDRVKCCRDSRRSFVLCDSLPQ